MPTPPSPGQDVLVQAYDTRNSYSTFENLRPVPLRLRRVTPGDVTQAKQRRFYLYSFDPDTGWSPNAAVPCVDLEQGQLFVNGVQIVEPQITDDHVAWVQHAEGPEGTHYLAGHLHLHSNGVEAHGVVVAGKNPRDAVSHAVVATAIPSVKYQTKITTDRYPADTDPNTLPDTAWSDGLPLELSYQQQIGNSVPTPVVKLDDQDISDLCSWSVNENYTVLNIALSDSDCEFAPELYAQASVSFDALMLNAPGVGVVRKTCGDPAASDRTAQLWRATVQTQPAAETPLTSPPLPHPQRQAVTRAQLLSIADDDSLDVRLLMGLLPNDQVNEDADSMLMRNMKWAMGQDSQQKEWLAKFFDEVPPAITEPDQQDLVKQGLVWYQNKFAMAYLTQSFNSYSGPNQPVHRLDTDQATTLSDYLKTGLAKDKDFNVQHQGIFIDAYVGAQPDLSRYINDNKSEYVGWAQGTVIFSRKDASEDLNVPAGVTVQTASGKVFMTQSNVTLPEGTMASDPVPIVANEAGIDSVVEANTITEFGDQSAKGIDSVTNPAATTLSPDTGGMKWAKKLFTELTTGANFILMVNRVAGAAGDPKALGPVNNLACLLTALDRSGEIARNYYQAVLSGLVVKLVPQVVHRDQDTIMQWLPTTLQELFRKLADGELPNENISKAEAEDMYEEFLKNQVDITSAIADLLAGIVATGLVKQATAAEQQFADTVATRWPKLAKAASFMLAIGWIGGVASVIASLVKGDWKKMTDFERAQLVDNCVQLSVTGFAAVPLIWQGVKYVTFTVWNKLNSWFNDAPQINEIQAQQVNVASPLEEPLIPQEAQNVNELIEASQATDTVGKGTIFERLFADGVFSGVLKAVGAAAAAAMAGFSMWQLIDDIKNHGSVTTEVFDGLMFSFNFLAAVCLIADLFIAASWIPIAGAILAIAGVIISVLANFFEKPSNPVDDWMVDHGIPFVNSLPPQTPSVASVRLGSLMA